MDGYNILYPKIRELTSFSSLNRAFITIHFILGHKAKFVSINFKE